MKKLGDLMLDLSPAPELRRDLYSIEARKEGRVNVLVVVGPGVEMVYASKRRAEAVEAVEVLNSAAAALAKKWKLNEVPSASGVGQGAEPPVIANTQT